MNSFRIIVLVFMIFCFQNIEAKDVYVKGYYKKNGTYVQGHYRTKPDKNPYNNYSAKGNVNPYTGKSGTKDINSDDQKNLKNTRSSTTNYSENKPSSSQENPPQNENVVPHVFSHNESL